MQRNIKIHIILFSLFIISTSLSSCFGIKHSTIGGSKSYYESFFIGDEGTQYFIKPIEFIADDAKLQMDITFRAKTELIDSATLNYTINHNILHKELTFVSINNGNTTIQINNHNLIYTERKSNKYNSRFSSKISMNEFAELTENDDWTMTIRSNEKEYSFRPTKKTRRILNYINNDIIILFK